jgi:hypothetical protein
VRQADATALPFGDASFDAALSVLMLHHVVEWERAVAETARVLRPGGVIVGADLLNSLPARLLHRLEGASYRMVTRRELRATLENLPFDQVAITTGRTRLAVRFTARKANPREAPPRLERHPATLRLRAFPTLSGHQGGLPGPLEMGHGAAEHRPISRLSSWPTIPAAPGRAQGCGRPVGRVRLGPDDQTRPGGSPEDGVGEEAESPQHRSGADPVRRRPAPLEPGAHVTLRRHQQRHCCFSSWRMSRRMAGCALSASFGSWQRSACADVTMRCGLLAADGQPWSGVSGG